VRQALAEIHQRLTGRRLDVHSRHSPFELAGEENEQELRESQGRSSWISSTRRAKSPIAWWTTRSRGP
jgi:hypothetical protein